MITWSPIFALLLLCGIATSQIPVFQKVLDLGPSAQSFNGDRPEFLCSTLDSGFVITESLDYCDCIGIVKLNKAGLFQWARKYQFPIILKPSHIQQASNGDLLVCGDYQKGLAWFLMRTDSVGNAIFFNYYVPPTNWFITNSSSAIFPGSYRVNRGSKIRMAEDSKGNIVCVSPVYYHPPIPNYIPPCGYAVFKTTPSGNLLWSNVYNMVLKEAFTSVRSADIGTFRLITGKDGYVIAANTTDTTTNSWENRIELLTLDENGFARWSKRYNFTGQDVISDVLPTIDLGFIITGSTFSTSQQTNPANILLMKVDSLGNPIWSKSFSTGNPASAYGYHIIQHQDLSFTLVGPHIDDITDINSLSNAFLLRTTSAGNAIWAQQYGTVVSSEDAMFVSSVRIGGFIFAGIRSSSLFGDDIYFVKTDLGGSSGCGEETLGLLATDIVPGIEPFANQSVLNLNIMTTGIADAYNNINEWTWCEGVGINEQNHTYMSIFPNPANNSLSVDLGSYQDVNEITLINTLGQIVQSNRINSSIRIRQFDVSTLTNGLYFINIALVNGNFLTAKFLKQ